MKSVRAMLAAVTLAVPLASGAQAADLAPGTEVVVAPADELSSRHLKTGDLFDITVTNDVVQDGVVVIPRDTPGHARVTWKTGKSVYGKSGKIEFELVDLQVAGALVPITGHYRVEGKGETGTTIAVTLIGGLVAGAVVVGHDATADRGTRWAARTAAPVALAASPWSQAAYAPAASGVRMANFVAPAAADPYAAGRAAARASLAAAGLDAQ